MTKRSCATADRLRLGGATEAATKAYEALLARPAADADCAVAGLAKLQKRAAPKKQGKAQ